MKAARNAENAFDEADKREVTWIQAHKGERPANKNFLRPCAVLKNWGLKSVFP